MTTKEQERKALEKIREIAESLGKDSYVLTAFKGAFELAEENIDNDFGCSMQDYVDRAEREKNDVIEELARTRKILDETTQAMKALAKERDDIMTMYNGCAKNRDMLTDNVRQLQYENSDLVVKCKDAEDEIIRLKAKLYDLLYSKGA